MKKLFSLVLIALVAMGYTQAQVDTVYTQNFSGGVPAGWANFGTSLGSPNPWAKWRWTTRGCHDAYDNGAKMTSPTAANGFLLFDSDSLDNGAVAGAFGLGPAPAPQVANLTTTAINIATTPFCRLQFYQYLRNFNSTTVVGISTDSTNWTLDTINASISTNQETATNSKITIDLSPYIAAGAHTGKLYLSFIMDANYYFWQIDDILITSLPDYNLNAIQSFGQKGTSGCFYSSIPLSQFTSTDSFQAFAQYGNTGSVTQTNINTEFTLYKTNTAIDSAPASPVVGSLAYGVDTTVTPSRPFVTNGMAKYTVAVDVRSSDSANFDPGTNRDSIYFSVTDSVFSNSTSLSSGSGAYYLLRTNAGSSFTLGNLYELTNPDTVTSVTTALLGGTGNTSPGSVVQASIYAVTIGATTISYNSTQPVVSTYNKTLATANLTQPGAPNLTPVTLPINYASGNAILPAGVYWVGVSAVSTPDSNVIIATSTATATGSLAAAPNPSVANQLQAFNISEPFVNMNLGHAASLLWASWSRNPATTPVKAGQSITFTGTSNATGSPVYTWTFYSDSDLYYESYDTGRVVTTSFPQSSTSFSGKDVITACVTVTDAGSTASYCNTINVRPLGVGINEVTQLADVALVPNPTTGKVNISADGINGTVSILVENMLGEVVRTFEGEANGSFSRTYDLSSLSNGLYLVRITNGGAAATKKLSISK